MRTPDVGDGLQYYTFMPWKTTLYGSRQAPLRWIRIVPYGATGNKILTTTLRKMTVENGVREKSITDIVTTVDLKQFLTRATYGDTEYIEAGITKLDGNNSLSDMYSNPAPFMTQAVLRAYEARANALIEAIEAKYKSLFRDVGLYEVLSDEFCAVCTLWEQAMNYGRIYPHNCIGSASSVSIYGTSAASISERRQKLNELEARLYYSNCCQLPYKVEGYQREKLLSVYGIAS